MSTQIDILVVEDDEAIATGIALNLKIAGYRAAVVGDGEAALAMLAEEPPQLVLLDINLPNRDGLEILGELRESGNPVPIIVLSARQGEHDKVAALRLGADDYVTKPFALAELLARIEAVLRRASGSQNSLPVQATDPAVTAFGTVEVNLSTRVVERSGREVRLTHLEFELLGFFLHHPNRVFSRDRLLREVWGLNHSGSPRTVDNFVGQLRSKLEQNPEQPRHFITVRGSGYRFDP